MKKKVQLSVVVPVYNAYNVLAECLDSICGFSGDVEIILIDDGSVDESFAICKEYANRDDRISVYRKRNGGASSARNYGIKKANGEYIMFVDADDVLMKNWGEIIEQIRDADIYYFSASANIKASRDTLFKYIVGMNEEGVYLSGPYSKMFRTDFLRDHDLHFDDEIVNGEDMLFNIDALVHAKTCEIIRQEFYLYRRMVGQSTRRFDANIIKSDRRFHRRLQEVFDKSNLEPKLTKDIEQFCLINAVVLILNRLSYAKKYALVKKYYVELEKNPYFAIINDLSNRHGARFLFVLCREKQYRLLFLLLKLKNNFAMIVRKIRNEKFAKI